MNNILLPPINIPCTLFETISLFDDFSADDMQYGDMVEQDFLSLGLSDISAKVDLTDLLNTISLAQVLLMLLLVPQVPEQKYHNVNALIFYLQK
ncbi:hypothetical protein VEE40_27940 [Escherichia coli]|nr:hypothetical protein VEE40_27940 [Escherichia coli]